MTQQTPETKNPNFFDIVDSEQKTPRRKLADIIKRPPELTQPEREETDAERLKRELEEDRKERDALYRREFSSE